MLQRAAELLDVSCVFSQTSLGPNQVLSVRRITLKLGEVIPHLGYAGKVFPPVSRPRGVAPTQSPRPAASPRCRRRPAGGVARPPQLPREIADTVSIDLSPDIGHCADTKYPYFVYV